MLIKTLQNTVFKRHRIWITMGGFCVSSLLFVPRPLLRILNKRLTKQTLIESSRWMQAIFIRHFRRSDISPEASAGCFRDFRIFLLERRECERDCDRVQRGVRRSLLAMIYHLLYFINTLCEPGRSLTLAGFINLPHFWDDNCGTFVSTSLDAQQRQAIIDSILLVKSGNFLKHLSLPFRWRRWIAWIIFKFQAPQFMHRRSFFRCGFWDSILGDEGSEKEKNEALQCCCK